MKCPRDGKLMTEGLEGSKCQKCGYINKPKGKIIVEREITNLKQIQVGKNYAKWGKMTW